MSFFGGQFFGGGFFFNSDTAEFRVCGPYVHDAYPAVSVSYSYDVRRRTG